MGEEGGHNPEKSSCDLYWSRWAAVSWAQGVGMWGCSGVAEIAGMHRVTGICSLEAGASGEGGVWKRKLELELFYFRCIALSIMTVLWIWLLYRGRTEVTVLKCPYF